MRGRKRSFYWEQLPPEKLWYLVGLITSDGSLSKDGRHIDITSKEISFLNEVKKSCNISNKITLKNKRRKNVAHRIQIGSTSFYGFLLSTGLIPNKSLTLGEVKVPEVVFHHFLRGVIDGDGCIRKWFHPTNEREQWSLRIYSGSPVFLSWLHVRILEIFGAKGKIYKNDLKKTDNSHVLKFGKLAAQEILFKCYGSKDTIMLKRKAKLANLCVSSKRGWGRSKTVNSNA